jgi:hypothetical protein
VESRPDCEVVSRPDCAAVSCLVFVFGAHGDTSLVPPVIGRTADEPDVAMPWTSSSAPLIRDLPVPRRPASRYDRREPAEAEGR